MELDLPASQEKLRELSGSLLEGLGMIARDIYGEELVSCGAYGSVGRGDLHENSDVDILLVANNLPAGRWNRLSQWEALEQKMEKQFSRFREKGWNWSLSPVIKTPDEVQNGSPLFLDMTEDCAIILDREDFLANYLAELKRKLEAQGARRIWTGRTWYWDLQPDFDPTRKVVL